MMDWYVSASSSSLFLTSRHNFRNAASGNSNLLSFSSFLNISRSHLPDKHGMNSPDGQEPCFLFRLSSTSHIRRELLSRTRGISVYAAYFPRRFYFIDLHIHYIGSGIFLITTSAFSPVSTEDKRVASLQYFKTIFHRLMLMLLVIWCISPIVQWGKQCFFWVFRLQHF